MMTMDASHISRDLYDWMQNKEQYGEIHSIFKSSINIINEDGKLIPILVSSKPMSPFSIRLESGFNFENLGIKIGEKGLFTKKTFKSKNINISYEKSLIWDNRIDLTTNMDTLENIEYKLNITKEFIENMGNKNGIYNLMQFIPGNIFGSNKGDIEDQSQLFIKERFINLIEGFTNYDIKMINNFSKKVIGFGPGLTPSMDDFISGMMIANLYISHFLQLSIENAYKLNEEIVKDIENMTTLVSKDMLKAASIGEVNEDIRNLMIALIGTSTNQNLYDILARVISFGHSSGTDILCGIYIGSYIILKNNK